METKEEIEKQINHAEYILQRIDFGKRSESHFHELFKILQEEYDLTGDNNLGQTIWKQGNTYIETRKKRPKRGAPNEYADFISNFRVDMTNLLTKYKYKLNSPTS